MKKIYPALVLSLLMAVSLIRGAEHYDVVVYGGTPHGSFTRETFRQSTQRPPDHVLPFIPVQPTGTQAAHVIRLFQQND